MRSWLSLMASSVPSRPSYFLVTLFRSMYKPSASSPMATETPPAPKSVSYTHLDVYKRQILHHLIEGKQLILVIDRTERGHTAAVPQLLHGSHVLFKIVPLVIDLVLLLLDLGRCV